MGGRFQMVFASFVIAIWVTTGIWLSEGIWTLTNTLMVAAAAALCLLVFVNFVWIFSYTYALTAIVVTLIIFQRDGAPTGALLLGTVLIVYGARLFWFVYARNRAASFRIRKREVVDADKALPFPVKIILFVFCTWLMAFLPMTTYLLAVHKLVNPGIVAGVVVVAIGLVIETVSDAQKQRAKGLDHTHWVSGGLWSRIRHPNYAGEILVQGGVVVAAVSASVVSGGFAWYETVAALLSPVYIVLLMLWSARNGDVRQLTTYGESLGYADYRARTGALLPVGKGPTATVRAT